MHTAHWNLKASPFRGSDGSEGYFHSPTHEEALARLHFLVEEQRHLGILSGPDGIGKSATLRVFADQLRRRGCVTGVLNLVGMDTYGFLWSLAALLGTNPASSDSEVTLWRTIDDRLREHQLQDVATVILLDDADQASHEVLLQTLRLVKTQPSMATVILGIESSRIARLGGDLLQLSQLRIPLEPWDWQDVRDFLTYSLKRVGGADGVFEEAAALRLQEVTNGIPRWVCQLADLALLAGAGQRLTSIDPETIDAVSQELADSFQDTCQSAGL